MVRLYQRTSRLGVAGSAMRTLLEASLGEPSMMASATARSQLIALARVLAVNAPATMVIRAREELTEWLAENRFPLVLKTDESFGGRGVRIVHSVAEADDAWRALSSPPSLARAVKRAIVNRDMNYVEPSLWRIRPVVNVQAFVWGQDANCTVACWQGKVLATITVAVLATVGLLGPASVIRVIENGAMSAAVEAIVRQLKLSGLIGFDFILEEGTDRAHLIEMNARATQTCHLQLGPGRDLLSPLRAVLSGEPLGQTRPMTGNDVIALFPQEWLRDPGSKFMSIAYHDIPWDEPDLLRECLTHTIEVRAWSRLSAVSRATRSWLAGTSRNGLGGPSRGEASHAR
jgi:hypothetical protein